MRFASAYEKEQSSLSSAARNQLYDTENYIDDSDWQPTKINSSTKLYSLDFQKNNGDIVGSNYFINEDTYNKYLRDDGSFDIQQYCNDAQIAPSSDYGTYKNHISCYEIPDGITVNGEEGTANANTQYGTGGAHQYYVSDEEKGKLQQDTSFKSPIINENERYLCHNEDGTPNVDESKQKARTMELEGFAMNKERRNELENGISNKDNSNTQGNENSNEENLHNDKDEGYDYYYGMGY